MKSMHRFACLTAACTFLLLIAGGLVTSTDSALAVPDWPLAYGQFFPPMVGGILFEHGHRMIAGVVGLMTLTLAVWVQRIEPRRWVRRLAAAAAVGIVLQALLGGITVLYLLPHPVSILHACLGQAVFCMILGVATSCGKFGAGFSATNFPQEHLNKSLHDRARSARSYQGLWRVGAAAVAIVYLQLVLGAVLRHTGGALVLHLLGALAVVAVVGALVRRVFSSHATDAVLTRPAALLALLVPLQLALGVAAYVVRSSPPLSSLWRSALPTAHVACGALILGACVAWTLRACSPGEGIDGEGAARA